MAHHPDWLDWQRQHTDALQVLQEAQRRYHRVLSGHAFSAENDAVKDRQKEALRVVDDARVQLDEVRARQPR